jgi:hypothetical protein
MVAVSSSQCDRVISSTFPDLILRTPSSRDKVTTELNIVQEFIQPMLRNAPLQKERAANMASSCCRLGGTGVSCPIALPIDLRTASATA